jgi:hypothetical protein
MSRLGTSTAFTAEAALWVAGAALIAGAVGMHWSVDLPAVSLLPAASTPQPIAAASTQPVLRLQAFFVKPTFQFKAKIQQTANVSGTGIAIQETASGTLTYRSGDATSSITTTILGVSSTEDQVVLGSITYIRENGGKWTKRSRLAADTGGSEQMFSATQPMTDKGLELKNGVQRHRLESQDTVPLANALSSGTSFDYQLSLVFWTADDGTLAAIEVSGTYHDIMQETPVTVTVDQNWTITSTTGVTITAPI